MWKIWQRCFPCKVDSLPMTYLGMPLGSSHKATTVSFLERMEKQLSGWIKLYFFFYK